ncbi:hypothetical protein ABL78_8416 [Leptomonas seymouri]|uniref:Uncharacterized protein n=1 Tax=Leptomonas seymouri TaxID=5684 RepID=A0A0N1HZ72_LEPSE|nr:hypothetical protein ABL78_8416 [Leptomonas seymouri]|eukprot:KPI82573.1 hypothetical protein ABL78_8416 [Leptomonas seymouri]
MREAHATAVEVLLHSLPRHPERAVSGLLEPACVSHLRVLLPLAVVIAPVAVPLHAATPRIAHLHNAQVLPLNVFRVEDRVGVTSHKSDLGIISCQLIVLAVWAPPGSVANDSVAGSNAAQKIVKKLNLRPVGLIRQSLVEARGGEARHILQRVQRVAGADLRVAAVQLRVRLLQNRGPDLRRVHSAPRVLQLSSRYGQVAVHKHTAPPPVLVERHAVRTDGVLALSSNLALRMAEHAHQARGVLRHRGNRAHHPGVAEVAGIHAPGAHVRAEQAHLRRHLLRQARLRAGPRKRLEGLRRAAVQRRLAGRELRVHERDPPLNARLQHILRVVAIRHLLDRRSLLGNLLLRHAAASAVVLVTQWHGAQLASEAVHAALHEHLRLRRVHNHLRHVLSLVVLRHRRVLQRLQL